MPWIGKDAKSAKNAKRANLVESPRISDNKMKLVAIQVIRKKATWQNNREKLPNG